MSFFKVDILTPNKAIAKDLEVDSLLVPTVSGQINLLPNHTHILEKLDTGILVVKTKNGDDYFSITTGVCKLIKDKVVILTNVCEHISELDFERAKTAKTKAQEKLNASAGMDQTDFIKYYRKLDRAEMRLKMLLLNK